MDRVSLPDDFDCNRLHSPPDLPMKIHTYRPPFRTLPTRRAAPLALMLLMLAPPALAAKWQPLSPGNKSAAVSIDVDTSSIVRSDGGKVRIWHRESYATRQLQEDWAFSFRQLAQLTEFQCDKRLATPVQRIWRGDNGEELKNARLTGGDAAPVVPDTPLERVFNRACRKAPASGSSETTDEGKKAAAQPPASGPVAWTYDGKLGPKHWGKLSTDYATCADGRMQSPIDIKAPLHVDLPPLRFNWRPVPLAIIDTGHTIRVNTEKAGDITFDGDEYALQGFSFRLPGEEVINGKRSAMSVQFELHGKAGRTAILAVPLAEGKENRLIRTLWSALPLEPGKMKTAATKIDPGQLIPQKRDYSVYVGSLTTPPCSEGVLWLVMKHPVSLSKAQIADFAKVHRNNARPVQATNGRVVKSGR